MNSRGNISEVRRNVSLPQAKTLVIGIGSHHGDDAAGWEVVRQLSQLLDSRFPKNDHGIVTRCASVPHDIFDWLESGATTHIVDAVLSTKTTVMRYEVRSIDDELCLDEWQNSGASCAERRTFRFKDLSNRLGSSSSHQFDLPSALRLALALGTLPKQLSLWTVPTGALPSTSVMNEQVLARSRECAQLLLSTIFSSVESVD